MSKVWETKEMVEICDLITCGVAKKPEYVDDGIPFLSAKNIKKGQVIWNNHKYISEKMHSELTKNNMPLKGDILYTRVGSFGEAAVVEEDVEFSVFVSLTLIKPKPTYVDKYFLKYFLNSDDVKKIAKNSISGSGVGNLNVGTVRKFRIPLPPLPQQKQIVATLDKAFAAIDTAKANAEQNLQNAKELFESYLQNIFENKGDDWVSSELNEFVNFIDYRGRTPVKTSSGVRLITAKNIKLGYLQVKPEEFIAEDNYEAWMTRGIPNFGDVIFTTEAPLGHIAQVNTKEKLAFAQRVIVMQPDAKKINQTFLKYLLLSNPIRNKILAQGTGATVLGIKSRLLKKIEIDFPNSIEEQKEIVIKLDILSVESKKLEAIYIQKNAALDEMKKSVLQKAFSGQLNTIN